MRARTYPALMVSMLLVACGGIEPEDSVSSIQQALELEDSGGLDMSDELPRFGLAELDEIDIEPNMDLPDLPQEMELLLGNLPGGDTDENDPEAAIEPSCKGLLKGHWKEIKNGYGVFYGKWASRNGAVMGHLKGIFGKNRKGRQVLFGKYISRSGQFKGLLKGRYGNGHFIARWHGLHGARGGLRGAYGQAKCITAADGTEKCLPGAGRFVGRWRATFGPCDRCALTCAPGHALAPNGLCICVPPNVIPCIYGECPETMFCDPCPPLPGCLDDQNCSAVCAPPICRPQPQMSGQDPS